MSGPSYTERQRAQLLALREADAVSKDHSRTVHALTLAGEGSTLVLGALRDRGLVESHVIRRDLRPMGGIATEYWLTAAGIAESERLAATLETADV